MSLGGTAIGLVVQSREGRPIKIEGNPGHPGSLGASDLFSQASLLNLYDPDRSKQVIHRHAPRPWDAALVAIRDALGKQRSTHGARLRVLTGAINSPTLATQLAKFLKDFRDAKWARYEACEDYRRAWASTAFREPVHPVYDLRRRMSF